MMIEQSINNMEFGALNTEIKRTMKRSAKSVIQLGFMLRRMLEEKVYLALYDDFDSYLESELHMDYTAATRFIKMNKKYSVLGNSAELSKEYEEYSQSLLIEMLNMPPELEAKVTSDMTVSQVREIKRQHKEKKVTEVSTAESEQIPGQTSIEEDFPELLPDQVIDGEYREIIENEKAATSQPDDIEKPHNEAWFVGQYVRFEPKEAEKLLEICRKERTNADRAKAIQKLLAPYGCHSSGCLEYDFQFNGFSRGIDFRMQQEKIHMKYSSLVVELMAILEENGEYTDNHLPFKLSKSESQEENLKEIPEEGIASVKYILEEQKRLLNAYLEVGSTPEMTIFKQKTIVGALASMVTELQSVKTEGQEQPELPVLKNNDQRKEWLAKYKDWGLWYRDENIDANYYKYDFEDGSRLVVTEYPKRHSYWSDERHDERYYHLLEKNKKGYKKTYDESYRHKEDSETYLVEFLKDLQKKGGK